MPYDSYFEDNLWHKKLFTVSVYNKEDNEGSLSDSEVVKLLIDYLVEPKSTMTQQKKEAFNRIRKIVKDNF